MTVLFNQLNYINNLFFNFQNHIVMKNQILLFLLFLSNAGFSQVFTNVTGTKLIDEYTTTYSKDVKSGDIDGDGDLDIVVAAYGQRNLVLYNVNGVFNVDTSRFLPALSSYPFPVTGEYSNGLELADFDGDGDLDILSVSISGSHEYLLNDGTGSFTFSTYSFPANQQAYSILVGDIGGDTLPDVIIGQQQNMIVYINDGDGTFTDQTSTYISNGGTYLFEDLDWADIDGDNDMDIVAGVYNSGCVVYINDNNVFSIDGSRIPSFPDVIDTKHITPADADGDGDIDIFLAKTDLNSSNGRDALLINDGTGNFTDGTSQLPFSFVPTYDAAFLDLNYDGLLDIITVHQDQNTNYKALINDVNNPGHFTLDNSFFPVSFEIPNGLCMHLRDFNDDGKPDIYFGNTSGFKNNNSLPAYDRLLYSILGVNTTQIENNIAISVFPNPTSDFINIQNLDAINIQKVSILSINGQKVFEQNINQSSDFKLNIPTLTTGVYNLLLHLDNEKIHVERIVVK